MTIARTAVSVDLKNVTKSFGRTRVVDSVDLHVEPGKLTTLLGPSGCGKTTTLRMIAGFHEPDSGEIYIGGRRVDVLPAYLRNTAMVFQDYALFPHMSIFSNVAYGLRIRGVRSEEIEKRVTEALELVQLAGMENRFPAQLSGGQQQRVALARALVIQPDALLLDEPLSNLDAKLREAVRSELRDIQQRTGITSIYVTHDQEEAFSLSDTVVVMSEGRIQQVGTPEDIYYRPANRFVAEFVGTTNLLSAVVLTAQREHVVLAAAGTTLVATSPGRRFAPGQSVLLTVRPESVHIAATTPPAGEEHRGEAGELNVLPCQVVKTTFLGSRSRHTVRLPDGTLWTVDVPDPGTATMTGGEAFVAFAPERTHVIASEAPGGTSASAG